MKIKSFIIINILNDLKDSYDSKKIDEKEYLAKYMNLVYTLYCSEKKQITREEFENLDTKEFVEFLSGLIKEVDNNFLMKTA
jgi:hypothetical protein